MLRDFYSSRVTRYLVPVDDDSGQLAFAVQDGPSVDAAAGGQARPRHCCDELTAHVEFRCDAHPRLGSCGDYLIGYHPTYDEYGLWIHDGEAGDASSWITIQHCPFCGTGLPRSRRMSWFDLLEARGVEPEDAPEDLQRYGWWLHL